MSVWSTESDAPGGFVGTAATAVVAAVTAVIWLDDLQIRAHTAQTFLFYFWLFLKDLDSFGLDDGLLISSRVTFNSTTNASFIGDGSSVDESDVQVTGKGSFDRHDGRWGKIFDMKDTKLANHDNAEIMRENKRCVW